MREEHQLQAIEAELRASGYDVARDAAPEFLELPKSVGRVDFLGRLRADRAGDEHQPAILIVEIANRSRRASTPQKDGTPSRRTSDESEAVKRFRAISEAVARLPETEVGFEIRFLDVSAEQEAARRLVSTRVRSRNNMGVKAREALGRLESVQNMDRTTHLLWIAHLWTHWVRVMAHRFPATARTELPWEDLRMIQKDLYDEKIVETAPADYHRIHEALMALAEGGDVEWDLIESLESDLRRIVTHFADHVEKVRDAAAPARATEPGTALFNEVEAAIRRHIPLGQQERALALFHDVRATDRTAEYRQALLNFIAAVRERPQLRDLITALVRRGSLIDE